MTEKMTEFYTVEEVSQMLRLTKKTIWKYIHEGKLPASKFGYMYRISGKDLEDFVERYKVTPGLIK